MSYKMTGASVQEQEESRNVEDEHLTSAVRLRCCVLPGLYSAQIFEHLV